MFIIWIMEITFDDIKHSIPKLSFKERAALARTLLEGLHEAETDVDLESVWAVEVERRSEAYITGEITSSPAEEVIERVRKQIRK